MHPPDKSRARCTCCMLLIADRPIRSNRSHIGAVHSGPDSLQEASAFSLSDTLFQLFGRSLSENMAKNQETRKRKHASRNGSSGRGNGADVARLNGKTKQKTAEETPGWQKTLGALVVIAAVLAAAFMTGVIRIDRNVEKSEGQDSVQEAQPTVAEIKDSKSNQTTSKYTPKEANANQASQETAEASKLNDKQHKDDAKNSAKDAKVEDKGTKVESRLKDKKAVVPDQSSQESTEDIPYKANTTKKKRDKVKIPEETSPGDVKVKEKNEQKENKVKTQTQERSSKEKKDIEDKVGISPEDGQKEETLKKERGKKVEPAQSGADTKTSKVQEPSVTETDSPKGKMVTPKRTPKNEQKSPKSKTKQPPVKDDSSKQKQTRGDGTVEVPSTSEGKAKRKEDETAPDGSESKLGAKQKASTSKKDGKVEEAAERKTGKDNVVRPPPPQEKIQPEEKRTIQGGTKSKDGKQAEDSSKKDRVKKSAENGKNEKEPVLKETESAKPKESGKKDVRVDSEKTKEKVQQEKPITKDPTPPKDSSTSSPSSMKSPKPVQDGKREQKSKEPSGKKEKKVIESQSETPLKDQSHEKPEDNPKTKPAKESPSKSPPPTDRPSKKEAKDPKVNSPQPPSTDKSEDSSKSKDSAKSKESPKAKTKSKVDPELPSPSPPSSQSKDSPKDDVVTKTTGDAHSGGGGRDKAAEDHIGDGTKAKEQVTRKTESKKPVDKKPAVKKSVLDNLLEEAETLVKNHKKDQALYKYEDIIKRFPNSAKALMAKAKLLDTLAEDRRSNELLESAIKSYRQAADAPHCPTDIHKEALSRMADRLSFFGKSMKSVRVYQELISAYPDDYEAKKNLAVQYLIMGNNEKAKPYFEQMIEDNPMDGFALVHLGFILKSEENYEEAIPLLRAGIDTGDRGTNVGKFFFQLGDSLLRTGQIEESYKVYDEGVKRGHFRSRYQRSLYNVDYLKGQPFWTVKDAGFAGAAKKLERHWETIRDEALALLGSDGYFRNEEEKLRETGDWKQFTLFAKGQKDHANCQQAPRTCEIFDTIPESKGCKRGQVKFSVMHPGTHVWPHCGPTNCRLRSHLGLVIPQPVRLRVGNVTRTWEEGKVFIFDDSFEHEVWQEADSLRLILIADLWHPDLTESDKRRLTPI